MLIFDAHLDLAMNAMEWNRDLTRPVSELRATERNMHDQPGRGENTVSFPDMRMGGVGLCVATQIAGVVAGNTAGPRQWNSQAQAWAQTRGQLAWYRAMQEAGQLTPIRNGAELAEHARRWREAMATESPPALPIGFILSLEGADSCPSPAHLEQAFAEGLRVVGPAHYGAGIYANGTGTSEGLPAGGKELLAEMSRLGLILDVSHLNDQCFWQALDLFSGPVWASHSNCRSLVLGDRQFSDAQIQALIERNAVIGLALHAAMLVPDWSADNEPPILLHHLVNHIDHICQLAGNSHHVGIGSDLDGGFGRRHLPAEVNTIADLNRLPTLLQKHGYSRKDQINFTHGNFLHFLCSAWKSNE